MSGLCYQNGHQSKHTPTTNGHCHVNGDIPKICTNGYSADKTNGYSADKTNGYSAENTNGYSVDTSTLEAHSPPLLGYDDLLGNIPIYNIWMRKFGKDKKIADQGWKEFRQDAILRYDAFDKKLTYLESIVNANNYDSAFLDMKCILQKKEDIHAVYMELGDYEVEVGHVTKVFQQFSQYLPNGAHRKQVNKMIRDIQQRYFNTLQELDRKKETLLWVIPRLQQYKSSISDFKTWLDSAESRSKSIARNINDWSLMLQNLECIEKLVEELHSHKGIYEHFIESGKGILGVDHQMEMNELEVELEDVEQRWDVLCESMETCVNRVAMERQAVELQNKSEMEKIHIKIQMEIKKCTCFTPFRIIKVDEGKYTFGASKTVRLLRIHGSSVVVRVGGGWEYLYTFLLKVDPCRAKQHATASPNNEVDAVKLSSLSLSPLNKQDEMLNITVKRLRKSSPSIGSKSKVNGDKLSKNGRSLSNPPATRRSKDKMNDGIDGGQDKSTNRRYSLIERQSQYAQKR